MAVPSSTMSQMPQNTGITSLTGGTALSTMVIRLFADVTKYLDPTETPFTSSMKTGSAVDQKKVEWVIGFLSPHQVTLGATQASGTGTTNLQLASGDANKLMLTDLLKIGSEIEWVVDIVDDSNVTVQRAMSGSSAGTHTYDGANPTVIDILGTAALENADSPFTNIAKGAEEYNYPQLFDQAIKVSNREDNTPDYEFDSGSKYNTYLERVMKVVAIKFEKAALMGRRGTEAAMSGATASPTTVGGLDFFTDREYDQSGSPMSDTVLQTIKRDLWEAVDSQYVPDKFLVGPFLRSAMSSLYNSQRIADVKDEETTLVWKRIDTDFGPVDFQLSRYIPSATGYLLKMESLSQHPYKGGTWSEVLLPSLGPYKQGRYTGDYTFIMKDQAARAKVTNISTDSDDYPNM